MIENDWDKIRKMAFQLVWGYRENENTDLWQNNTGQDNESRIEIELDRMLSHIKNPESPLHMLVGRVPDDILSEYIATWITAPFESRKLISQLNFKGMRYNHSDLLGKYKFVENSNNSTKIEEAERKLLTIYAEREADFDPKRMESVILDLTKQIRMTSNRYEYLMAFEKLKTCIIEIEISLMEEKALAVNYNLECVYYRRVSSYIQIVEMMVQELLFSIIVRYRLDKQEERLKNILDELSLCEEYMNKLTESGIELIYQQLVVDQTGKKISPANQALVLWLQYRDYVEEAKQIENLLEEDIENNKDFFLSWKPVRYEMESQYHGKNQLIKDLEEKETISTRGDNYKRLDKTKAYIDYESRKGKINYLDKNNTYILRVIYRELFRNKAKLKDKSRRNITASSIVQDLLDGVKVEKRHEIFLNEKIRRGDFRELQLLTEYRYYNEIVQKCREILNKIFLLPNDVLMYGVICYDVGIKLIQLIEEQYI